MPSPDRTAPSAGGRSAPDRSQLKRPSGNTSNTKVGSIRRMLCTWMRPLSNGPRATRTSSSFSRAMSASDAPGALASRASRTVSAGDGSSDRPMSPFRSTARPVAADTRSAISAL